MSSLPRLPELAREVAEIANGVVAAGRAAGRDDLAQLLVDAAGRWSAAGTTVALVGESGVGKTALLNALVGQPVLPTRDAVDRSPLAVVRPGPAPAVTASGTGSPLPLALEPGAIAAWLEQRGPVSEGVTSLEVVVVDPATGPATTLVDTPGVAPGGAGRSRAVVTAQACDVLLFVTDADSPLTRPELDLLTASRGTAGAVLVALTRQDRFRGWSQVLDADRELLAAELGTSVDVLPVSSSLAAAAAGLRGRDDVGSEALEEESGVLALRDRLRALSERTRELRLLGLLRLSSDVGAELQADAALTSVAREEAARQADELQADLERLRGATAELVTALGDEAQRLRESLVVEVKRAGTAALATYEAGRGSRRRPEEEDHAALLDDLDAARLELEARVAEQLEQLSGWLLERLEGAADADSPVAAPVPRAAPVQTGGKDRSMRLRLAAALVSTGSGAVLLGTMFAPELGTAVLRSSLMSAGMLGGGLSAVAALTQSGRQRVATVARAAVRALVDEWQAVTTSALRSAVSAGQRRADAAVRTAVAEAVEARTRQVAELRARAAGADAPAQGPDGRALRAHLERAAELTALLEARP